MSFEAFDMSKIEENRKKYAKEVKERWGNTDAYQEHKEKTESYDEKQYELFYGEGAKILKKFGEMRHMSAEDKQVQELVKEWQDFITKHFYKCTDEILSGLGSMYTADERFTKNIDKNGEGTAAFLSQAIRIYCTK